MTPEANAHAVSETQAVFVSPHYFSPFDVVRDRALSAAEKKIILADWASDARALPNLPSYRQLDNGTLLQVSEIFEALNALDGVRERGEPAWPTRCARRSSGARWLQRMLRRTRDDDDDDPPPVPARMPRPRPSGPSAEAVSPIAA